MAHQNIKGYFVTSRSGVGWKNLVTAIIGKIEFILFFGVTRFVRVSSSSQINNRSIICLDINMEQPSRFVIICLF